MKEKFTIMQQKENILKEYIDKVETSYQSLKPLVQRTSVANQRIDFSKKSLIFPEAIYEEDMAEGEYGSDYENEEIEQKDEELKNQLQGNWKKSAFIGKYPVKNKKLKKSAVDGFFKNKLRYKIKKPKRAKSK